MFCNRIWVACPWLLSSANSNSRASILWESDISKCRVAEVSPKIGDKRGVQNVVSAKDVEESEFTPKVPMVITRASGPASF